MEVDRSVRGQMATKLLEAADALDLPRSVVRSKSKGYQVPEELHRYLFPSEYADDEPQLPLGELEGMASHPASTELDNGEPNPDSDPASDFGGLTEAELEALTNPNEE